MKENKKRLPLEKAASMIYSKSNYKVNHFQLHNKIFSDKNRRLDYGKSC
jgi:hypothetical protein